MNRPNFVCSTYNVTVEHPSDWTVNRVVNKSVQTSLGGTQMEDMYYRKYSYVLRWDAMIDSEYDDLEELINYSIDNDANITFTYRKWSQSLSGIAVRAILPARKKKAGSGEDNYYSSVELYLTEVSAR